VNAGTDVFEKRDSQNDPSVVVTHSGRQYAGEAVRAAQDAGLLQAYVTGVHFGGSDPISRIIRSVAVRQPRGLLRSVYGRIYREIDSDRIVSFPVYPLIGRLLRPLPTGSDCERGLIERWGTQAGDWLERQPSPPRVVHSFEGQALEVFRAARRVGATTILDANNAFEFASEELGAEGISFASDDHARRIYEERELADYVFAPSDWVRDCLIANGVPDERVVKIPLGTAAGVGVAQRSVHDGPTRFLFVGHIGARKGVRYVLEAWRRGIPDAELILIGGADEFGRELLRDLPDNVTHMGYVSWPMLQSRFDVADVFLFPSLAEGSALVNYQALASGLPVITTPNAGSVVRDGVDGFLVPARDVSALTNRMRQISADADLRLQLGANAAARIANGFTWTHYRARVAAVYNALVTGEPVPLEPA
jgi:glycosyltransferase involved in cell wall biosynthesis